LNSIVCSAGCTRSWSISICLRQCSDQTRCHI
jgi:hypothetical protein